MVSPGGVLETTPRVQPCAQKNPLKYKNNISTVIKVMSIDCKQHKIKKEDNS